VTAPFTRLFVVFATVFIVLIEFETLEFVELMTFDCCEAADAMPLLTALLISSKILPPEFDGWGVGGGLTGMLVAIGILSMVALLAAALRAAL